MSYNLVLGIRLDEETYSLITKIARAQGIGKADFVRRAVKRELAKLSFLPEEEKKALEVVKND